MAMFLFSRDAFHNVLHHKGSALSSILTTNKPVVSLPPQQQPPIPPSAPSHKTATIPAHLDHHLDPSILQQVVYHVKDAIGGPKSDVQRQAERIRMDPEERQLMRNRFLSDKPWTPNGNPFLSTSDVHQQGIISMVWTVLRDAMGYVMWDLQDLSQYFTQHRNGVWSWFDLSHDIGFLWRLGVTALIAMGAMQLIGVTDSLVRLVDGVMGIMERVFGFAWSQLGGIRQNVMAMFTDM